MFRSFATSTAALLALALLPVAAPARPHPTPTPTVTPSPPPADPAITAIARHEFVAWQAGVVDKSRYAPETQPKLTDEQIANTSRALAALGALVRTQWWGPLGIVDGPAGVKGYIYQMICTDGKVYEQLTIDSATGKIDGIFFRDKL
ncbi:MAG TPA: hypothetical protein VMF11_14240 [Candidatus Baltobacteraceae bacterium]|nr:hypothetical protein [Candidatus Baltobacteraceae bacterium]